MLGVIVVRVAVGRPGAEVCGFVIRGQRSPGSVVLEAGSVRVVGAQSVGIAGRVGHTCRVVLAVTVRAVDVHKVVDGDAVRRAAVIAVAGVLVVHDGFSRCGAHRASGIPLAGRPTT